MSYKPVLDTRPRVVTPRARGYKHRPIISVVGEQGLTEHGEIVNNLPLYAYNSEPHLWVTNDPTGLARIMRDHFGKYEWFTLGAIRSLDPDPTLGRVLGRPAGRIVNFGFDARGHGSAPGRRRTARHTIIHASGIFRAPGAAHDVLGGSSHTHLQRLVIDMREWCRRENLPIARTLASLGAALLRDGRFWPESRGRVPRATNDKVRPYLPGVQNVLHAPVSRRFPTAIAADQHRAYHTIAQQVATPDPTTLMAKGFFREPGDRVCARPHTKAYARVTGQPGLLAMRGQSRPTRIGELRLPCLDYGGTETIYLWSNELAAAIAQGFTPNGLVAAWTSSRPDTGLPLYGAWAIEQIAGADAYRRQWLKPALHSTYGLLAARTRDCEHLEHNGKGDDIDEWYFNGYSFTFHRRTRKGVSAPFVNIAMLGVLQAETRLRTLNKARELQDLGAQILHTSADGFHFQIDALPLGIEECGRWTLEPRTNLRYEDHVSYLSDERDCLPGRSRSKARDRAYRLSVAGSRRAF